jgi:hypothetical protein
MEDTAGAPLVLLVSFSCTTYRSFGIFSWKSNQVYRSIDNLPFDWKSKS